MCDTCHGTLAGGKTTDESAERSHVEPEISLIIDDARMRAEILIRGPFNPSFDYDYFIRLLDEHKIVFGVDAPALRRLAEDYRVGKSEGRSYRGLVSEGMPPQPGRDGQVEILIPDPPQVNIDEHGRADFRNIQKFQTVEKGQVLAKLIPPLPGKSGTDIFGQEVKPPEPLRPVLENGENVTFVPAKNEYIAGVHGIFVKGEKKIAVSPVLIISASVGLASGNVNYDGNVRIGGNVERGSMVSCFGDCEIGGMIESGDVRIGGTLRVHKGINTRQEGNVNVGGNLLAVYVENTQATIEGSVIIQKSLINSKLICYGDIILQGKGSTITGGEHLAFGSVTMDILGSKTEIPTKLVVGTNFKYSQYHDLHRKELEEVEKAYEKKVEEINKIKIYVQRMRGRIPVDKQAAMRVRYREYKDMVELRQRLQQQITELRESRYNQGEVRVIIRDVAYPGAIIFYRDHIEKITAPLTRCVLRFRPGYEKPEMQGYRD